MKGMMKTISLLLVGSLAAVGCAQDVEEINLVQNNVTKKGELKGEFYFRSTVIQAPYASYGYFVGNQNYHMERGVFEITENTLFFYRTYEHAIGGETLGAAPDIDTPLYQTDENGDVLKDENDKPMPVTYQRRIGNEIVTVQRYIYRGSPIVAFPIASHFDIKAGYNTLTGEQNNVISEESSDREWWERDFMRVSWGASQVGHVDENILIPGAIAELQDEQHSADEAPVKVYEEDGTLGYFDYRVHKVTGAPLAWYGQSGFDYIPACWYYPWYLGQVAECTSERITFRQAFMKVKPSDYVAWDYDDTLLKKFGYYRIERATYDATRGVTFAGVTRRVRRHRIWENYAVKKGAACTIDGNDVHAGCGANEVCEPVGTEGTFCVHADVNERLDYGQMTAKPIVWYLSEQFPRELVPETVQLAKNWNKPFVDVVTARKGAAPGHDMFVLCENSMAEALGALVSYGRIGDVTDVANIDAVIAQAQADGILAQVGAPCLNMDAAKRNGDLRYSQIHSVNPPTSVGLYGYGPSSADPMTGEMISANSYMYTPAMKRGANMAMLTIELLTGVRNFWETVYANQVEYSGNKKRLGAATGGLPSWTIAKAQNAGKGLIAPTVRERLETVGVDKTDANHAANRLAMLPTSNPKLAKMFITDDVRLLHREPALGDAVTESVESQVDRLGMHKWAHDGGMIAEKRKYHASTAQQGCMFMEEFADNAIIGLAREYADEMNKDVCEAAAAADNTVFDFTEFDFIGGKCTKLGLSQDGLQLCATIADEAGGAAGPYWTNPCTIGKLKAQLANRLVQLEQMNPYNLSQDYYPPDPVYTDTKHEIVHNSQVALLDAIEKSRTHIITRLWKRIYQGVAEHEIGHSLGLRHNFEASTDAMNFGEKYWNLKGKFGGDGKFNAFNMFQTETELQAQSSMRQMQSSSVMDYSAKFNDRFDGVGAYDRAAIKFGYGGLVEVFKTNPDVAKFEKYMADPAADDPSNVPTLPDSKMYLESMFKRVHYTKIPELFGEVAKIDQRVDVPWTSIKDGKVTSGEHAGKWEAPYRFCSDELAGRHPTCERWDSGVDPFEITRNAIDDYENYWPLWGHWHDSLLFFPDNYYGRILRVFGMMKMQMQWWVAEYQRFNKNDWWKTNFSVTWDDDPLGGLAGRTAVIDSVNTMSATFGRPEPGLHGYRASRGVWEPVPWLDNSLYTSTDYITQLNCDARSLYPSWDYSGYLPNVTRAGAIYERLAALQMLSDPTTNFEAVDEMNDIQRYLISYYSLFPKELMNLYGGMIANKTDNYGWYMKLDGEGAPDGCHRRVLIGPEAGPPSADPANYWPYNPEPEYTFPTTRFRVPMLAAYYGLGLFVDGYDHNFVDVTRVFVDGHSQAITPSADAEVLSFEDPLSGKVYSATQSKYADGIFHPAYFMIERMKEEFQSYGSLAELQDEYNYSEYQFILDKLELLRGMNYTYDYGE